MLLNALGTEALAMLAWRRCTSACVGVLSSFHVGFDRQLTSLPMYQVSYFGCFFFCRFFLSCSAGELVVHEYRSGMPRVCANVCNGQAHWLQQHRLQQHTRHTFDDGKMPSYIMHTDLRYLPHLFRTGIHSANQRT